MKKLSLKFVTTTAILCVGIMFSSNLSLRSHNVLFAMNDAKHDDNGAGKIQYPKQLQDKKGVLDITSFKVKESKENIIFEYTMDKIDNEYESKNGFSHLMLDTYISVDNENGLFSTKDYGSVVMFSDEGPWLYRIKITPEESFIEKVTDIVSRETEKIPIDISLNGSTVSTTINKTILGEDMKSAKYYVFSGGYDKFASDGYRRVVGEESDWEFYGGIRSLYQPNVIDIVSPIQKDMLIYFMPPQYANIIPVFNRGIQLYITKEMLYGGLLLWYFIRVKMFHKRKELFKSEDC